MKNLIKNKRGFSLIELMVVVAIMGTLAAIAIPAYNEYRKSAKKTAYKSDLLSLHRGWLAFGVELDSYCARETKPREATLSNVGMVSLFSSKLYGNQGSAADANCNVGGTPTPANLLPASCSASTPGACSGCSNGTFTPYDAGNGPGKVNFIGFAQESCDGGTPGNSVAGNHYLYDGTNPGPSACVLGITTYRMGVAGHISGDQYVGINVVQTGILDENDSAAATASLSDACT